MAYAEIVTRLKNSYYEIQEASRDLSNEDVYFDAEEQNEIEQRLDLINSLKRKYGNNIEQILEYKAQIEKEIFNWLPGMHYSSGIYCSLPLSTFFFLSFFLCFLIKDQDKGITYYLWSNRGIFLGK